MVAGEAMAVMPVKIQENRLCHLGSVHTWCPGTSARVPAQNGAVFRHKVTNLKMCSCSKNRAHAHYCEIVVKVLGN